MSDEKKPWRLGFPCPHCGKRSTAAKKRSLHELLMEVVYRCENIRCGHIFVVSCEAVRTLSPSACTNPAIALPMSEHVRRGALAALLELPAANDPVDASELPLALRTRDLFEEGAAVG